MKILHAEAAPGQGLGPRPKRQALPMGQLIMTRGVNDRVAMDAGFSKFVLLSLRRHRSGDWGDLDAEDKAANDWSRGNGERILSAYGTDPKIWIITEADRSVTTVLFPEEY